MALKPCRECGEQISDDAKTCPKCGKKNPINSPIKKWLWIAAVVIVLIAIGSHRQQEQAAQSVSGTNASPNVSGTNGGSRKTSAYIEEGRKVVGIYTTIGAIRLNATAEDVGCTPSKDLECSFSDSTGTYTATFYQEPSQPNIYRICDYHYKFSVPDSMSNNEVYQMLEKKLGPGEFGRAQIVSDQYFWGDWTDSGVGGKAFRGDDGRMEVIVTDGPKFHLHLGQLQQAESEQETKEKQAAEKRFNSN